MFNKKNITEAISLALFGLVFFSIIFGILFLFTSTILNILGFEYDSYLSLIKFCILYFIISIPIDFVVEAFFKVIYELINITKFQCTLLYIFVDVCINTTLFGFLDFILKDINCSLITALLFSIISSVVGCILENKSNDKDLDLSKELDD